MTNSELLAMHISAVKMIAEMKLENISVNAECRFKRGDIVVDITVFDSERSNVWFAFYSCRENEDKRLEEVLKIIELDNFAKVKELRESQNPSYIPSNVVGAA